MLLNAPLPERTEAQRADLRARLAGSQGHWRVVWLEGGEGCSLEVWRLCRPNPKGVAIYLHGFGDDAWGTLGRAAELPDWDAVGFTFRGRDRNPSVPCTLGAWKRKDVVAVVHWLEAQGIPRSRVILAGWSMGAGVALLALADLEREGTPLAGALLECPYEHLNAAARDHLRGPLGCGELLVRPAEHLAIRKAGQRARFRPDEVSPVEAARGLRTPIALVTGGSDVVAPLKGVQAIAVHHPDLTVVPKAGHCQAGNQLPGGWGGWARQKLDLWRVGSNGN